MVIGGEVKGGREKREIRCKTDTEYLNGRRKKKCTILEGVESKDIEKNKVGKKSAKSTNHAWKNHEAIRFKFKISLRPGKGE